MRVVHAESCICSGFFEAFGWKFDSIAHSSTMVGRIGPEFNIPYRESTREVIENASGDGSIMQSAESAKSGMLMRGQLPDNGHPLPVNGLAAIREKLGISEGKHTHGASSPPTVRADAITRPTPRLGGGSPSRSDEGWPQRDTRFRQLAQEQHSSSGKGGGAASVAVKASQRALEVRSSESTSSTAAQLAPGGRESAAEEHRELGADAPDPMAPALSGGRTLRERFEEQQRLHRAEEEALKEERRGARAREIEKERKRVEESERELAALRQQAAEAAQNAQTEEEQIGGHSDSSSKDQTSSTPVSGRMGTGARGAEGLVPLAKRDKTVWNATTLTSPFYNVTVHVRKRIFRGVKFPLSVAKTPLRSESVGSTGGDGVMPKQVQMQQPPEIKTFVSETSSTGLVILTATELKAGQMSLNNEYGTMKYTIDKDYEECSNVDVGTRIPLTNGLKLDVPDPGNPEDASNKAFNRILLYVEFTDVEDYHNFKGDLEKVRKISDIIRKNLATLCSIFDDNQLSSVPSAYNEPASGSERLLFGQEIMNKVSKEDIETSNEGIQFGVVIELGAKDNDGQTAIQPDGRGDPLPVAANQKYFPLKSQVEYYVTQNAGPVASDVAWSGTQEAKMAVKLLQDKFFESSNPEGYFSVKQILSRRSMGGGVSLFDLLSKFSVVDLESNSIVSSLEKACESMYEKISKMFQEISIMSQEKKLLSDDAPKNKEYDEILQHCREQIFIAVDALAGRAEFALKKRRSELTIVESQITIAYESIKKPSNSAMPDDSVKEAWREDAAPEMLQVSPVVLHYREILILESKLLGTTKLVMQELQVEELDKKAAGSTMAAVAPEISLQTAPPVVLDRIAAEPAILLPQIVMGLHPDGDIMIENATAAIARAHAAEQAAKARRAVISQKFSEMTAKVLAVQRGADAAAAQKDLSEEASGVGPVSTRASSTPSDVPIESDDDDELRADPMPTTEGETAKKRPISALARDFGDLKLEYFANMQTALVPHRKESFVPARIEKEAMLQEKVLLDTQIGSEIFKMLRLSLHEESPLGQPLAAHTIDVATLPGYVAGSMLIEGSSLRVILTGDEVPIRQLPVIHKNDFLTIVKAMMREHFEKVSKSKQQLGEGDLSWMTRQLAYALAPAESVAKVDNMLAAAQQMADFAALHIDGLDDLQPQVMFLARLTDHEKHMLFCRAHLWHSHFVKCQDSLSTNRKKIVTFMNGKIKEWTGVDPLDSSPGREQIPTLEQVQIMQRQLGHLFSSERGPTLHTYAVFIQSVISSKMDAIFEDADAGSQETYEKFKDAFGRTVAFFEIRYSILHKRLCISACI